MVLANPPYTIKQWNREAWTSDSWGRNFLGTPPQGRADYAFFQHILKSMDNKTGRCAILFPHGVLFRKEEADMRQKLVDADLVDCVLGLGANLFYNSTMEACVVICHNNKPAKRRGKVIFIDAVDEVTRDRTKNYLSLEHQDRIAKAYHSFVSETGFVAIATIDEIAKQQYSLSIPLYVRKLANDRSMDIENNNQRKLWKMWNESSQILGKDVNALLSMLDKLNSAEDKNG
jgi:type I restriction enzyme M protein